MVAFLAVRARLGVVLGASWGGLVAARGHLGRLMGSSGSPTAAFGGPVGASLVLHDQHQSKHSGSM